MEPIHVTLKAAENAVGEDPSPAEIYYYLLWARRSSDVPLPGGISQKRISELLCGSDFTEEEAERVAKLFDVDARLFLKGESEG